jgi:hypothetical protein
MFVVNFEVRVYDCGVVSAGSLSVTTVVNQGAEALCGRELIATS